MNLTFKKEERLCSKKAFENLLASGTSLFCFPFKLIWVKTDFPLSYPAQIAISVPKKRFKRAYERNLLKRRIKEAVRLNKPKFYLFLNNKEIRIQLLIVYVAPKVMTYNEIEPKIKATLDNLVAAIEKTAN